MSARAVIDSLKFAREGGSLAGEIPVAHLPRIAGQVASPTGSVSYRLSGGWEEGKPVLRLAVTGEIRLNCQRCLGELRYALKIDMRYFLVEGEASLGDLSEEDESWTEIVADKQLDVVKLVEDEVLLGIPMAPRHEDGACQRIVDDAGDGGEAHPFAALRRLNKENQQT